ncbi:hypothetical protein KJA15_01170 [Patescibacteria group bacterium]|nr:hypothetical protein [Patescibacteria group bacterium]
MRQLKNKKILITAGPVWVPIDKIRVITNIFKGALGLLIAKGAIKRGARVTLLLGPGSLCFPERCPKNLKVIRFKFFTELYRLMRDEISSRKYDVVIHSAAVADYMPIKYYKGKIKSRENLVIKLRPTEKIVDQIKKWCPEVFLVKFKLEVNLNKKELIKRAYKSMMASNADLMVANDFKDISKKDHKAFIIDINKNIIPCNQKKGIAKKLLNVIFNKI